MKRSALVLIGGSLTLAACRSDLPTAVAPGHQAPSFAANPSPSGRYIVAYRDEVEDDEDEDDRQEQALGFKTRHRYNSALKGFAADLTPSAADALARNPRVKYVVPDLKATIAEAGTRTLTGSQWGLDRLDQQSTATRDNLYGYQNQGDGVEVYILDTGIRYTHQEFGGRALSLYDYVDLDADAQECHGHGTHVAGTVGGATVGVANKVTLYGVRVLDCMGSGSFSGIIAAIDSVTKRKQARPNIPMVGNMSLGGAGVYQPVLDAIARSTAAGVVWAIAAGNSNVDACTTSPAAAPSALTVGAANGADTRSSFSNWGSCVDLFAPGEGIWSSTKTADNSYESWAGTSMATPHVAGVAALYLAANPTASAAQVNAAVIGGATANVITDPMGSPNRLLYSLISGAAVAPPPLASFTLSVTTTGTGAGSVTGAGIACGTAGTDCSETITQGGTITLTAAPAAGSTFAGWSGSCTGTSATCTVSMSAAQSVTANFATVVPTHVGDLEGAVTGTSKSSWSASFSVTVHSEAHAAVSGAIVSVSFSGSTSGNTSCTTGSTGRCTINRSNIRGTSGSVTFRVTGISKAGTQYVASQNHDANGNSNGTQFTVTR
ncbi:MAG: S8 family serine peptidase [Gemmatimonadaceae bacterium]|nr:S8 family serine peptidase [Gemmatimonadaceae bacterium]